MSGEARWFCVALATVDETGSDYAEDFGLRWARANECRKMAAQMKDPQHKNQLEEMAETWTMLAREGEKRLNRQGGSSRAEGNLAHSH